MKTVGGFRRSRYVGLEWTGLCGELAATAYNLVRMSRLIPELEAEVPVFSWCAVVEVRLLDSDRAPRAGSEMSLTKMSPG